MVNYINFSENYEYSNQTITKKTMPTIRKAPAQCATVPSQLTRTFAASDNHVEDAGPGGNDGCCISE